MNRWTLDERVFRLAPAVGQFATTLVVLWLAGVGREKDMFDAALALPWFALLVLAGPHVSRAIASVTNEVASLPWEARRTFSSAVRGMITVQALTAALGVASSTWLASTLFRGVGSSDRLGGLIRVQFVALFLLSAAMVLSTGAAQRERRVVAWACPGFLAAGAAGAAVVFGTETRVEDVTWGTLAGGLVALVVVAWRVERRGIGLDWQTPWMHRSLPTFVRSSGPITVVAALLAVEAMIPALAGQYADSGSIALLTGLRWPVVTAAALAAIPAGAGGGRAVTTPTIMRAGFFTALLVGLAPPLVATMFSLGPIDGEPVSTGWVVLMILGLATPFIVIAETGLQTSARQLRIGLAALALVSLPISIAVAGAAGSAAVALVWTVHVAVAAGVTAWVGRRATGPARDEVGRTAAFGRLVALALTIAVGAATSWAGEALGLPPLLTVVAGVALATTAWGLAVHSTGAHPWGVLRGVDEWEREPE